MVFLPQDVSGPPAFPSLDIVVAVPGSLQAPVADIAKYPGASVTTPPAGWAAANLNGFYYEVRGRALRLEHVVGQVGFTPRTRLGFHLSIAPWQDSSPISAYGGFIPPVILSQSLSDAGTNALMNHTLFDPAYGPVIRVGNDPLLHPGDMITPLWVVNLQISENKDDDWSNLGHA
jgi:hypothetical protein